MKSNTVKLAASSKLASHSLRPKGEEAFPMQLLDNRPEAREQAQLQEQINNSPRVMQLRAYQHQPHHTSAQREALNIHAPSQQQAASGGVVQLSRWGEWEKPLAAAASAIQTRALFGMAVVNEFRESSVNARIGGSLAAKMMGGVREPADLDLEIPGRAEAGADAKAMFIGWIGRKVFRSEGGGVFYISAYTTPSGVLEVTYHGLTSNVVLDMLDDNYDEKAVAQLITDLKAAPAHKTKVDFSSEALFTMSDMAPTDTKVDDRGHYGAEYLIASYLNRLAYNKKNNTTDEKHDWEQIVAMLHALVAKGDEKSKAPAGKVEITGFLTQVKSRIMAYIKSATNTKEASIVQLLEQACEAVLSGGAKKPVQGASSASVEAQPATWLTITEDTYRAIKEIAEDRWLDDEADDLVDAFKAGGPYTSKETIVAVLLRVIPQKQDAVNRIAEYIVENYAN